MVQMLISVAVVIVLVVGSLLVDVSGAWFQFSELLLQFSDMLILWMMALWLM